MTLFAKTALTPTGWEENVSIKIGEDGRITKVIANTTPQPEQVHVGHLLPAPVNAHSHAFQRTMAGLTEQRGENPTDSFWTWRQLMFKFLNQLTPQHVLAITAFVQMEMLEAGYATNVEFHYLHHQIGGTPYDNIAELSQCIANAASISGIGLTLLPVHYQFGGCDQRALGEGQIRFSNTLPQFVKLVEGAAASLKHLPDDANLGVAPHSLRAVGKDSLDTLPGLVREGPVHMHLAEQIPEVDEVKASWGKRPVEWFLDNVDVDERWCLIHCTQMLPHETRGLAETGAVAGLCPITESSLGDGIFDGVNWLEHGGRMAIGSDSNIRISLSEEIRTLDYSQRLRDNSRAALATVEKSTARRIWDKITEGGAVASKRDTGSIKEGKWADLVALNEQHHNFANRSGDTLLDSFVFAADDRAITDVWSAGRHMVRSGKHVRHDEITRNYVETLRSLTMKL